MAVSSGFHIGGLGGNRQFAAYMGGMTLPAISLGAGFRGMESTTMFHQGNRPVGLSPLGGATAAQHMEPGQSLYGRAIGASQIAPRLDFATGMPAKLGIVKMPKQPRQQQQQRRPGQPPGPGPTPGFKALGTRPPSTLNQGELPERTGIRPWGTTPELGAAPTARPQGPGPMTAVGPATMGPRIAGELGPAPTARPHGGPTPAGELNRAWDIPQPPAGGWARPELTQGEPAVPMGTGAQEPGQMGFPSAVVGEPVPSTRPRGRRQQFNAPNQPQAPLDLED